MGKNFLGLKTFLGEIFFWRKFAGENFFLVKFFRGKFFSGENFLGENFFDPCPLKEGGGSDGGDRGDGGDGGGEVDQGEVSTIILEMLESSGF